MKNKTFKYLREYFLITLGLFVNTLGWTAFLIPSEIVGGGITGVGTLVYFATGLPVGVTFFAINIFLVAIAFRKLGGDFGIKTIYSIIMISVFFSVLQSMITQPVVNDKFMAAIIGAILCGASIGLVFTQGGSTGGTDIIAKLINQYRNISPGKVILSCDIIIISSSFLLFRSLETMVYGYVTMAITGYAIDLVLVGASQSVQLFILSKNTEAIAKRIGDEVRRGITLINGKGWYTKENMDIIMVVVRKYESQRVFRIVKEMDPDAFISVNSVMGVYGKGFDKIR